MKQNGGVWDQGDAEKRAVWSLCALGLTVRGAGPSGRLRGTVDVGMNIPQSHPLSVTSLAFVVSIVFLEGHVSSFTATCPSHPLPAFQIQCLGLPGRRHWKL